MSKSIYSAPQDVLLSLMREMRLAAGMTQTDLAGKLGVQQGVISKCERGSRRLDVIELYQWLAALGVKFTVFAEELDARLQGQTKLFKLTSERSKR